MRVISLLPSATETVATLGHSSWLVGRSEECDFPPEVAALPVVMRARSLDRDHSSSEIDARVRETRAKHQSLYQLDLDLLERLSPDLLTTQDLCSVCSVTEEEVADACRRSGISPRIVSLSPTRLAEVWDNIRTVSEALGDPSAGEQLLRTLRPDERAQATGSKVAIVEWLDPPILAGLWTPDIIERAGGIPVLGRAGEPGIRTDWERLGQEEIDLLTLSPCSFDVPRTRRELTDPSDRRSGRPDPAPTRDVVGRRGLLQPTRAKARGGGPAGPRARSPVRSDRPDAGGTVVAPRSAPGGRTMSAWRPTSNYLYGTPALPARRPVTTSRTELIHITIAFVVLSVDFTILISSWGQDLYTGVLRTSFSLYEILFGVLAGFSGFLAHELAHKISAERSGYWAEFRMSPFGLLLSLITSVLGFLWAAPGATVIGGMQDIRAWGRTSLAGPAMNLGEGAILVAAAGGVDLLGYGTLASLLALVALINAVLRGVQPAPIRSSGRAQGLDLEQGRVGGQLRRRGGVRDRHGDRAVHLDPTGMRDGDGGHQRPGTGSEPTPS